MSRRDFFFWLKGFMSDKTELSDHDVFELKQKLNEVVLFSSKEHVVFDDRIPDIPYNPDVQLSFDWERK